MKIKKPGLLLFCIFISQMAGVIGSAFTASSVTTWYTTLQKPSFNPPNWVFGPVWITLYTLMGISLYLVWVRGKKSEWQVKVFFVQLVINALWSIIFFGLHDLALALVVIGFLWLLIAYLIKIFGEASKWAAYLLVPYLLWVSFASLLNFAIWRLN